MHWGGGVGGGGVTHRLIHNITTDFGASDVQKSTFPLVVENMDSERKKKWLMEATGALYALMTERGFSLSDKKGTRCLEIL